MSGLEKVEIWPFSGANSLFMVYGCRMHQFFKQWVVQNFFLSVMFLENSHQLLILIVLLEIYFLHIRHKNNGRLHASTFPIFPQIELFAIPYLSSCSNGYLHDF